ncbi:hypothetical protein HanIR_Chr05g0233081 [Helianthus annuus]|nr:hypothetical protein HanIR_Chr05g0233081 [Helianthus annuus]
MKHFYWFKTYSFYFLQKISSHLNSQLCIYIYIYRERERENKPTNGTKCFY